MRRTAFYRVLVALSLRSKGAARQSDMQPGDFPFARLGYYSQSIGQLGSIVWRVPERRQQCVNMLCLSQALHSNSYPILDRYPEAAP